MKRKIAHMLFVIAMLTVMFCGCNPKDDTPLDPVLPDEVEMRFVSDEPLGRGDQVIRPYSTVIFSSELKWCQINMVYKYEGYEILERAYTLYHTFNPSDYTYREYMPFRFSEYTRGWPQEPGQYEMIVGLHCGDYFLGTMTCIIAIIE